MHSILKPGIINEDETVVRAKEKMPNLRLLVEDSTGQIKECRTLPVSERKTSGLEINEPFRNCWFFVDTSTRDLNMYAFKRGNHMTKIDANTRNYVLKSNGYPHETI
jgi:hypothetical protein